MGLYSWRTQDTDESIPCEYADRPTFTVYMSNGVKTWQEVNYEGYGIFGGKDYYELLDEMNDGSGDRDRGIDLAFSGKKEVIFPSLNKFPHSKFTGREPELCSNQGYFYPEYDDEDEDY